MPPSYRAYNRVSQQLFDEINDGRRPQKPPPASLEQPRHPAFAPKQRFGARYLALTNDGDLEAMGLADTERPPAVSGTEMLPEAAEPQLGPQKRRRGERGPDKQPRKSPEAVAAPSPTPPEPEPKGMLLFCPKCRLPHVDALDPATGLDWARIPHKTHQCQEPGCKHEWRPFKYPTSGLPHPERTPAVKAARRWNAWGNRFPKPGSAVQKELQGKPQPAVPESTGPGWADHLARKKTP